MKSPPYFAGANLLIMKKITFLLTVGIQAISGFAQLSDSFTDGDFITNPAWTGNTASWVVHASQRLQSNSIQANGSFWLSTTSNLATMAQWEWHTELAFNTSSANYVDVFLMASAADPAATSTTGYFVRLGGTDDDICLYRKDATGMAIKIIDGQNGLLNSSGTRVKIRVTRSSNQQWTLLRDLTGSGNSYAAEGTAIDATYTASAYFSIFVRQSTASFFQKHFFDDIEVKPYAPDTIPPQLLSMQIVNDHTIDLLFNEPVTLATSQLSQNYTINNGIGYPDSARRDPLDNALVHLSFSGMFPGDMPCMLTVQGVEDASANTMLSTIKTFIWHYTRPYDIIIDELMPDPSPPVGLPVAEWIELKNTSVFPINIAGWQLQHSSGQSGPFPSFTLLPDSSCIICPTAAQSQLASYGRAIGISNFPSLNNTGDRLILTDAGGKTIHTLRYADTWYGNDLKKEGGWSLEMKDIHNPCGGMGNWAASTSPTGGTPGKKNTVDGPYPDTDPPRLLHAYAEDSLHPVLVFDETLDSASATLTSQYRCNRDIGFPDTATILPFFDRVRLRLHSPLQPHTVYEVSVDNIKDCTGNNVTGNTALCGLSTPADSLNLVINEILFNPRPGGVDYIELYNRSTHIINLARLYIANRNSNGQLANIQVLSAEHRLFFPGTYIVISEDPRAVRAQYICKDTGALLQVNNMPSFPDDKGVVAILNAAGKIIDEVQYNQGWHFQLISNPEGVALERINAAAASQDPSNWYSAATHTGYGTPTSKNSQYQNTTSKESELTVTPDVFSPDQDGYNDFATINYHFPQPGYVASITLFDFAGRPVRFLQRNALCGITGSFRWDGLGEQNKPLPLGIYIVYTEAFHPDGTVKRFKQPVVLARSW